MTPNRNVAKYQLLQIPPREIISKFWTRTKFVNGKCWLWKGEINAYGYGLFRFENRTWIASRFIWQVFNGPAPLDRVVDHECRNRACVNQVT